MLNHGTSMKRIQSLALLLLLGIHSLTSYAADVRVCNKGNAALTNLDVNSWKIPKLDAGDCTAYFNNPGAQEYVTVSVRVDGNILGFRPKRTSFLLGEGKFTYQVSVNNDRLQLVTVKD